MHTCRNLADPFKDKKNLPSLITLRHFILPCAHSWLHAFSCQTLGILRGKTICVLMPNLAVAADLVSASDNWRLVRGKTVSGYARLLEEWACPGAWGGAYAPSVWRVVTTEVCIQWAASGIGHCGCPLLFAVLISGPPASADGSSYGSSLSR